MSALSALAPYLGGSAAGAIVTWLLNLRSSQAAASRVVAADAVVAHDRVVEDAVAARRQIHEEQVADRQALRSELNDTRDRLSKVEQRLDEVNDELSRERNSREVLVVAARLCTQSDACPVLAAASSSIPLPMNGKG
jgi:chromosome segregation ATPase